jgi:thymidylate synthase ThyX
MTGNIRSWIHYLAQRLDPHAQKEHREVAEKIRDIFADVPRREHVLVLRKDA